MNHFSLIFSRVDETFRLKNIVIGYNTTKLQYKILQHFNCGKLQMSKEKKK